MTTEYPVELNFGDGRSELTVLRAKDWPTALIAARTGWGQSWTHVNVTNPDTLETVDVAWKRTHGDMSPEEWVARRIAPPLEVPIVSIDAFLAALQPQVMGYPGETVNRPVWIKINDMLYAPAQIGLDSEHGAIIIIPSVEPSATHGLAPQ